MQLTYGEMAGEQRAHQKNRVKSDKGFDTHPTLAREQQFFKSF